MSSTFEALAPLLSRSRVKVLAVLLVDPDRESYLREIARAAGVPLRAVQRELALYESIGLIHRRPRGREVFIAVDRTHPLFVGLRSLLAAEADGPGSAAPDPGVLESAAAGSPQVRETLLERTAKRLRGSVPGSEPGGISIQSPAPAPAGVRTKSVSSGKGPRQSVRHVPAADESWRMW